MQEFYKAYHDLRREYRLTHYVRSDAHGTKIQIWDGNGKKVCDVKVEDEETCYKMALNRLSTHYRRIDDGTTETV